MFQSVANKASSLHLGDCRGVGFSPFIEFAQENRGIIAYLVSQNIKAVHNTVQGGGKIPKNPPHTGELYDRRDVCQGLQRPGIAAVYVWVCKQNPTATHEVLAV